MLWRKLTTTYSPQTQIQRRRLERKFSHGTTTSKQITFPNDQTVQSDRRVKEAKWITGRAS
eukprot:4315797-Amphidinium_carterae.3